MNKQDFYKFFKGFVTGGGAALTAFLQDHGCKFTDLGTFTKAAALGVASGLVHALWNKYGEAITKFFFKS